MKLNRTSAFWDRVTRNEINENWDTIEGLSSELDGMYDDLRSDVESLKKDKSHFGNLVYNGDFRHGVDGWEEGVFGKIGYRDNKLVLEGDGVTSIVRASQTIDRHFGAGDVLFVDGYFKSLNNDCYQMGFLMYDESGESIGNILTTDFEKDERINVNGNLTISENISKLRLQLRSRYESAEMSNGKEVEVDNITALNLTNIFGKGNEPSAEEVKGYIERFPNLFYHEEAIINAIIDLNSENKSKLKNLVYNGDFKAAKGWDVGSFGNVIYRDNKLVLEGDGVSSIVRTSQDIDLRFNQGDILFVDGDFKSLNDDCYQMGFLLYDESVSSIGNLLSTSFDVDKETNINGNITLNKDISALRLQLRSRYDNAEISIGKKVEVRNVTLINLTDFFGKGNEPSAKEMKKILEALPNGFIDDNTSLADTQKALVQSIFERTKGGGAVDLRKPIIMVSFDDAFKTDYEVVFPRFRTRGIPATSYVWVGRVGTHAPSMTWEQLHELKNAGWGIECHTFSHPHMDRLTDEEIHEQFQLVNQHMQANGFPNPRHHVLPYGSGIGDSRVINIAKQYRKTVKARLDFATYDDFDFYYTPSINIDINEDKGNLHRIDYVKNIIDTVVDQRAIMHIYGHAIKEDPVGSYEGDIDILMEIVDYALDKDMEFLTADGVYRRVVDYRRATGQM